MKENEDVVEIIGYVTTHDPERHVFPRISRSAAPDLLDVLGSVEDDFDEREANSVETKVRKVERSA